MPIGNVLGNGDPMVAYRDDGAIGGWTSSDGTSWQQLAVAGATPTAAGNHPVLDLTMLPVGLLRIADGRTSRLRAAGS
jgi:hypothetical protein